MLGRLILETGCRERVGRADVKMRLGVKVGLGVGVGLVKREGWL